jgi:cell division protein ZapA
MEQSKVRVAIFGQTYTIKGDASPDYIEELAAYINDKMEDICGRSSTINPTQAAILAAMNIADEYFQLKNSGTPDSGIIEEKTRALISMLDQGLIGDIFARQGVQ